MRPSSTCQAILDGKLKKQMSILERTLLFPSVLSLGKGPASGIFLLDYKESQAIEVVSASACVSWYSETSLRSEIMPPRQDQQRLHQENTQLRQQVDMLTQQMTQLQTQIDTINQRATGRIPARDAPQRDRRDRNRRGCGGERIDTPSVSSDDDDTESLNNPFATLGHPEAPPAADMRRWENV